MLLLIDNFDSFTYNLAQAFQVLGIEIKVVRGNALSLADCLQLKPDYIVIGPGPGTPSDFPLSKQLILNAVHVPLLGICLGHQAIAEVYGGLITRAKKPMHGKTSAILHDEEGLFRGVCQGFIATRYHSLIVDNQNLPSCLKVTAYTQEGEIMGLRHLQYSQESLQFHPESILTLQGQKLLRNFLDKGSSFSLP